MRRRAVWCLASLAPVSPRIGCASVWCPDDSGAPPLRRAGPARAPFSKTLQPCTCCRTHSSIIMHTSFTPVRDSVFLCQQTFRALLQALARPCLPGLLPRDLAHARLPLPRELAIIALTLCDQTNTLWLSKSLATEPVRSWLRFYTGSTFTVSPARADFALAASLAEAPDLESLPQGSTTYPDRSATLIVADINFAAEGSLPLLATGPGIQGELRVPFALPHNFAASWQANHARFPQGVDVVFCGQGKVAGLPRSTRLQPAGISHTPLAGTA